ncbi:hypothetical protein Dsin_000408 [Dipteronia sinensis]|uniref:GIR1-like zinc ribbon domain-containing protein n=1 Tax=Dipteronia sinensis TaxID=43782 RepID=A0AAE0B2B0_9ROSI|nr:hypothetical protein Dsin_000408 [Dipteronia sinensis]
MASYSRQLNLNEEYDNGNEVDGDVNLNINQFRQEFPRSFDLNLPALRTKLHEVNNISHAYYNRIDVMKNNIEGDRVIDLNNCQFCQEFPRLSNSRQLNLNEEYNIGNEVDGDVMINNIEGARVIDLNIDQFRQEFSRSFDLNQHALGTNVREINNISHTYCDNIEGARVIDLNINQLLQEFPISYDSRQLNLNEEYDTRNEVDSDVIIHNIEDARVIDLNIDQLRQEFLKSFDLNQPTLETNLREVNNISHTYCDKIDVMKNNIEGARVIDLNIDQLHQEFPRSSNSRQLNLNEEYNTRNEDGNDVMINNIEGDGVIDLNNNQLRQEFPRSSNLNRPSLGTNLQEVNNISHSYCEKIDVMKNNIEGARVIDLNIDQLHQGFPRSSNLNRPALGSNLREVNNISHTYCNKVGNAKRKWPMEMKTSPDEDEHEKNSRANLEISSSPPPSTDHQRSCMYNLDLNSEYIPDDDDEEENHPKKKKKDGGIPSDLIVMGCFRCLMYVMVSGAEPQCPKCKSIVLIDQFRVKPPAKK